MASPKGQLSPKHWKALQLIEEGTLSLKEIAKTLNWCPDTLYDLYEGNYQKHGEIGILFHEELAKITARNTAKIKTLTKDNQKLALIKMNEYLRELQKQPPTPESTKELTTILNSLSKSVPNVEIGSLSYSYTKGLNAEDLLNEFKRLSTLARNALDGRGIPGPEQG